MARLARQPLSTARCAELYRMVSEQVSDAIQSTEDTELVFDMGAMTWAPVQFQCHRRLTYRLSPSEAQPPGEAS